MLESGTNSILREMRKRPLTIDLGPWPDPGRPRVLIELENQERGLELAAAIRQTGCVVGLCRGPDASADPATRCPLHKLEPCVAVEGADVVVTALDLATDDGRQVLRGLRTRYPSTPLVVEATPAESLELSDLLEGCTVLPVDEDPDRVAAAVRAALSDAHYV